MAKYITVGKRANIFHDPVSGITVCKGDIVEVSNRHLMSKRVKGAINAGHLIYVDKAAEEAKADEGVNTEALLQKFNSLSAKHDSDSAKIAKNFTLDELKELAKSLDIEPEDNDTKEDLVKAILEE